MDNEKKPEFLKKILKKEGYKAVNENPALDEKKALEPLKDESATLPEKKGKQERIEKARTDGGSYGRGRGGDIKTDPIVEGEKKTPSQKVLEKGGRKSWSGGSSGRGGATITKEPDEILKEKQDAVNPEEPLSHKKGEKPLEVANAQDKNQPEQKKQESQPQQAQHKSSFLKSLDAKIQEQVSKQGKPQTEKSVAEKPAPKREGIISKIEKKIEEVKKSTAEKPKTKTPKIEIAKTSPKPIIKGR